MPFPPPLARHHPSDVLTGLGLGFFISYAIYRQLYPSFTHAECDTLKTRLNTTAAAAAANGDAGGVLVEEREGLLSRTAGGGGADPNAPP